MKKYSTKKALIASLLMLCLSFTSLAGTTFAWFTDSVTSNNNLIQSGNLDVEMEYSADLEKWNVITETTNMFSDDLWEPGHVAVVYLKVKNAGSLALRYRLNVNVASETGSVNVYGEDFKLSNNIGYGVVENVTTKFATRADAIKKVGEDKFVHLEVPYAPEKQDLYPANDIPDGGVSETVIALVVYMPEDIENEANHAKGAPIPTINLGINLFATQLVYESDSFGPDYDEPADRVIAKDEIAEFEGEEIVGQITNAGNTTIKDVEISDGDRIIQNNGGNLEIKDTTVNQTAGTDYIVRNESTESEDGTIIFNNVNATSLGGGVSVFGGKTIFESGSIVTNSNSTSSRHVFFVNNGGYLEINDGDFAFSPSNLTRKGFYVCAQNGSTVVITGGNFAKPSTRGSSTASTNYKAGMYADATSSIVITGGSFAFDPTNWVALGYEAVKEGDIWIVGPIAPVADQNELNASIANNSTVVLPEGEFTLPTLSGKEGVTIIGNPDGSTVIGGESATTGFGSNFGKDTTVQNVTFAGSSNGVRWSYAQGGTSVFDNCTFAGDSVYGFHIDQSNGATFIFNNCTFSGFNAFAGDLVKVVFNNCTFENNGNYGHTNIWSNAEFNNCTWGADTSVSVADGGSLKFDGVEESYYHVYAATAGKLESFAADTADGESWKLTLLADLSLNNAKLAVGANAASTLDLGGHILTVANTNAAASCAVENKGELTVMNGTVIYEGVGDPSFGYGTNTINNSGKLVIAEDAKVVNTTNSGSSVAIDCAAGADLTVNGGIIESQKNAIRLCPFGGEAINCTINGGTITGARAIQIQLPSSTPTSAPEINLTINGGTFDSNVEDGLAIYSYSAGQSFANVKVEFNGGTFKDAVAFGGGAKTTQETVTVNGGTFESDLGRYLENDGWEDIAH